MSKVKKNQKLFYSSAWLSSTTVLFSLLFLYSCNKNINHLQSDKRIDKEKEIFYEFLNHEIIRAKKFLDRNCKKCQDKVFVQKIVFFGDPGFETNSLATYYKWRQTFQFDHSKVIILDNKDWLDTTLIQKSDIVLDYKFKNDRALSSQPYMIFTPFYSFNPKTDEFIIGVGSYSYDEQYSLILKYRKIGKNKFKMIEEIDGIVAH